ncbi:flagellar basal body rod protein FlgB [Taurinivorans muris]|uniref:Flagellar basal body rod protein FlgB n=1 Tax=Taurinivorans muris TaxID=2787751 RepID=A0ABY5Y530_9BACT|nr:flagellar basal body rod protein FlgB [Mailhella sp.]MDE7012245.1 flagellar basal body rod protein FlgB [Mailhella sp.]UWX06477.1 flagellar basal body rod protein FlgB [Desulfovibrionaceae bacterium LT0009]
MKSLDQDHMQLVSRVMDMQLQRQNVIMGNITNVNTPNYKPLELTFEKELQQALNLDAKGKISRTSSEHIPSVFDSKTFNADWLKRFMPRRAHGEDRVNIDKEMVKMAKNNLQYTTLSQVTKSGYDSLKSIITEASKV